MKAYIIYPDRDLTDAQKSRVDRYAEKLTGEGWEVHLPRMLHGQHGPAEALEVLHERSEAIRAADHVFVFWDMRSSSCQFDLGTAFALGKKIELLRIFDGDQVVDNPLIGMQVMQQFAKLAQRSSVVPVVEARTPHSYTPD